MMYGYGMGGWGYALMAIGMILFWGAVIYGIAALVRYAVPRWFFGVYAALSGVPS